MHKYKIDLSFVQTKNIKLIFKDIQVHKIDMGNGRYIIWIVVSCPNSSDLVWCLVHEGLHGIIKCFHESGVVDWRFGASEL